MRQLLHTAVVLVVISAAAGLAAAQDLPPIPTEDDASGYPRELVDRPILLPGMAELEANLAVPSNDTFDFFDLIVLNLGGRYGNGSIEVFASAGFLILQPDETAFEKFSRISGGGAVLVAPDQVLRATLHVFDPLDDELNIFEALGTYEVKRKLAPKLAVQGLAGVDFWNPVLKDPPPDPIYVVSFVVGAEGQFQATPELALVGAGFVLVPLASSPDSLQTESVVNLSAGGLYSVGPEFDLFGRLVLTDVFDEDQNGTQLVAGALARM